jgi:NADH-quinone oxidoreductase subunit N
MSIIVYQDFCVISGNELRIEFITLTLLATLGIFLSLSSRDFLLLFCGLELQALSNYALTGFNLSTLKSSEGALKYFILGALVSCITLFGISFIYGFGGSLQFNVILEILNSAPSLNIGLVVGVVLMLSGVFFKLSAAPLHVWAPDVYEGAPITAVTYFATAPKFGILIVLLNLITFVIGEYKQISVELVRIVAILSMLIGALGAIRQVSLKRLMAYSTILNVGYVLIGVSLHSPEGNLAAGLYMLIYIAGVMGFFACLIALLGPRAEDATFDSIAGIASSRKTIATCISIIMFSNIGLPPLAGFFGKYYLFYEAIVQEEYVLAIIGISTSVVAAYYYLKIIRSMYFVETIGQIERIPTKRGLLFVTALMVAFILFFSFFSTNFLNYLSVLSR